MTQKLQYSEEETAARVADMMTYHPWGEDQKVSGSLVCEALSEALRVIMNVVPSCPDRSTAIRKIREARMDCNSALTHRGKY